MTLTMWLPELFDYRNHLITGKKFQEPGKISGNAPRLQSSAEYQMIPVHFKPNRPFDTLTIWIPSWPVLYYH
jgi:hypothetical protein